MLEGLLLAHKDRPQYTTKFIDGTVVYFHLLSQKEYDAFTSLRKELNLADDLFFEYVFNFCVPLEWKNIEGNVRAGIPRSIGEFIYSYSMSYENIEEELDVVRARYNQNDLYEQMKIVIITAFPSYTFEDLELRDRPSLIKLFVRAEAIMQIKTDGKYKPVNLKKMKAKNKKNSGIDFAKENQEISKEFGNPGSGDDPFSRNGAAYNLAQIRETATRKAEARREKLRNG